MLNKEHFMSFITPHGQIDGTSLTLGRFKGKRLIIRKTDQFIFKNECVFAGYKKLVGDEDKMEGLLVNAQVTSLMLQSMNNNENSLILQNAVRLLWNMVPDDGSTNIMQIRHDLLNETNML